MNIQVYLKVHSNLLGIVDGAAFSPDDESLIRCLSFSHAVTVPYEEGIYQLVSPISHKKLSIVKQVDAATPDLYQILCNQEVLPTVKLFVYRYNRLGLAELFYTLALKQVKIVGIKSGFASDTISAVDWPMTEDVSLVYSSISWTVNGSSNRTYSTDIGGS